MTSLIRCKVAALNFFGFISHAGRSELYEDVSRRGVGVHSRVRKYTDGAVTTPLGKLHEVELRMLGFGQSGNYSDASSGSILVSKVHQCLDTWPESECIRRSVRSNTHPIVIPHTLSSWDRSWPRVWNLYSDSVYADKFHNVRPSLFRFLLLV